MNVALDEILNAMLERRGSDLHLRAGRAPLFRIAGKIVASEFPALSAEELQELTTSLLPDGLGDRLEQTRGVDFSYTIGERARFRANAFYERGQLALVLRAVPLKIPNIDQLFLPPVVSDLALSNSGLVLVTGPTGSGKSTTLASMIDHANAHRQAHIITLEDPVEFVYSDRSSTVTQREIGSDTPSFSAGLKHVLRQDPDIILIGEMRDPETIQTAVTAAETGHLVLSTLHTNSAPQTIDRIVDSFPADQQRQVRYQLASVLRAVISQRLVPLSGRPGRVAAVEIMINSPQVVSHIAQGETARLHRVIEESGGYYRMQTLNQSLALLLKKELIALDAAEAASDDADELHRILRHHGIHIEEAPEEQPQEA